MTVNHCPACAKPGKLTAVVNSKVRITTNYCKNHTWVPEWNRQQEKQAKARWRFRQGILCPRELID